jgi:curli biogenesis system outer membrane secretion channel CsgG
VLEFEVKAKGAPRDAGRGLSEMFITALHKTGRFIVLERAAIEAIFREQGFGISGAVKSGTEVKIGEMLGAQTLVKGVITEFQENQKRIDAGGFTSRFKNLGIVTVEGYVAIDIRIFDAATGVILHTCRVEGKVSKKGLTGAVLIKGIAIGAGKFEETALGEASRKAIQDAVNFIIKNMEDVPWQGRVVSVQDTKVYINAGQDTGIKGGDCLEVYKRGEELVDPDTGMSLGYQISKIGYAQISSIEDKFSIAHVVKGSGGKGDIVKLLEGGIEDVPPPPPPPPPPPKMRIMVVIPEVHITRKIPDPAGETEIIKKLLEKGFDVVDPKMVDAIRYDEQVAKAMKDEKAAAAIGRDYGAEVVIIGEAFSEFAGRQPGGMISCRARVEARAIKVDTGNILAADGKHGSGMDISENVAAKTALRQAGGELADYFIEQLKSVSEQPKNAEGAKPPASAGTVQILLSKIQSYGQLIQFEKAIKSIEGVKEVHRLSFSEGTARLDVECSCDAQRLADGLYLQDLGDFKIDIKSFSANKLEVEIK